MNTSITKKELALYLTGTFSLFAIVMFGISLYLTSSNRVAYGVMAENCRLDGMTINEARKFFEEAGRLKLAHKSIHLTYGTQSWIITPEEIGLVPNANEAAEVAFAVGRKSGDPFKNLIMRFKCARNGYTVDMDASYDEAMLQARLDSIAAEIFKEPVNAYCLLNSDGSVTRIAGVVGKKLDTESLAQNLAASLKNFNLPKIELTPLEQPPYVRTEDIANINSVLASYTTYFSPGDRGENIALAAEKLDGILIKSGYNLSFNDTVGERSSSAGYKNAGVIIDGRLEDGIGGGICQVSSTLYNAILLAGLDAIERTAHFSPSSYCPAGRDATVSYGLLDFQFTNSLPSNIYLLTETDSSEITVYVLGNINDLNGNTITLETEGSHMSPSLYRAYYRDGQLVEREFLHTDGYSELVTEENQM